MNFPFRNHENLHQIANAIIEHFAALCTIYPHPPRPQYSVTPTAITTCTFLFEVGHIQGSKENKAVIPPGHIPLRLVKEINYNKSLQTGTYTTRWKASTVTALPKVVHVTCLEQLLPVALKHTFRKTGGPRGFPRPGRHATPH